MAYRSSSTNTGTSFSEPSVTVPAGVVSGDIIILVAVTDLSADTFTFPSGFTELFDIDVTLDGQSIGIGWKRTTGADSGSYTFTVPTSILWMCHAYAFSGRHATDPPVSSSATSNSGNTSPVSVNAATVTAVAGDDLLWVSAPDVNTSGAGTGHTPPSGYIERQDAELTFLNLSAATKENVGAGATGTVTGTFTMASGTAGWAAFLVRIPAVPSAFIAEVGTQIRQAVKRAATY